MSTAPGSGSVSSGSVPSGPVTRAAGRDLGSVPAVAAGAPPDPWRPVWAVHLTWPDAVASHLTAARAFGLPVPADLRPAGRRAGAGRRGTFAVVDVLFEADRLVIEVDGWAAHGSREALERDRRRQSRLTNAGYRVLRFTWQDLQQRPGAVLAEVRAALGRLGRSRQA